MKEIKISKKPNKPTKKSTEDIKKEIKEVCQKIVLEQEIVKMRNDSQQRLNQAKEQLIFWDTRIKQETGTLASYNLILQRSQTPKSLILNDNTEPKKEKK